MKEPSFDKLAEIIRERCGLDSYERIEPDTQFERDLGVTGDDGEELLETVGKRFGVTLTRESFNLEPMSISSDRKRASPICSPSSESARQKHFVHLPSANSSKQ